MGEKKYILSVDQGTTSSRAIIFNKDAEIIVSNQKEFEQIYPENGWVEQRAEDIWNSELEVIRQCVASVGVENIAAIGITNQRETTIVWDKNTGEPIYHAIVWQCRRTAKRIDEVKKDGMEDYIRENTGLIADPYFSATKIEWILENVEGAREKAEKGELLFGTVDTWLIWKLTEGKVHATDYTNASRTMLFNIKTLEWDEKLLDYFGIPKSMLPEVRPSSYIFGDVRKSLLAGDVNVNDSGASAGGLGAGGESDNTIPIAGVAGDQQSALFGHCGFNAGDVKNTYGTGSFILMNTGERQVESKNGLITTIAASLSDDVQYALEGSVFIAGAAVQWLRDELKMIKDASDTYALSVNVPDSNGVYVVSAFTGLGAPYWNPYARGTVFGITRGCKKEHFVRATLESVAYQTNDVIDAMKKDSGMELGQLKVDGGASGNDFLMQFQSDITDVVVERPNCLEITALGAAYLAGLAVGYYKDLGEVQKINGNKRLFKPAYDKEKREELVRGWKKAVKCVNEFYG